MRNSLETRLGIFVVLAVFAAILVIEMLGGLESLRTGYHVSALFDTVQELKVGDTVKMAGVEIGRVEKIVFDNNKVKVTMKLHSDANVKTDSQAVIKFAGLMGQNFVSVNFGSPDAPKAVDGSVIASEEQPDLSAIMAKLDKAAAGIQNLTKSFSGDTINNLLGPLTDLIKQNSAHISATLSNMESISGQIASGQGTVGKVIYDQALYNSALDTVTNLQDTIGQVRGVVDGISSGKGTIGKLVNDDALYNSTQASMTNLNQILFKINHGEGTIGKLVNNQEFYQNAKVSLQKLDKAADSIEDTGPLSVIGIVVGRLF
ncbi:MAG: MlaD family protein [Verrucomicrobiales bacterium]|nr:MlaD family protein [Verrucomicrobiales bacterium]